MWLWGHSFFDTKTLLHASSVLVHINIVVIPYVGIEIHDYEKHNEYGPTKVVFTVITNFYCRCRTPVVDRLLEQF